MPNNNVVMNANVQEPLEVVENFQGNTDATTATETESTSAETDPTVEAVTEGTTAAMTESNSSTTSSSNMNINNYLPGTGNSATPSNDGGVINASLLNAGHHFGIDTQGCSLRNANRGLRSEPPNPQVQVSPWLQTTICPDLMRKPLDCPLDN